MTIAIVDYGSGNLRSVAKALEQASRRAGMAAPVEVTSHAEVVARAGRIVLPGVGAFGECRRGLDALDGMVAALEEAVLEGGKPFLGICVGMQLMAGVGHEHGEHRGLGWIPGAVEALAPAEPSLKVPHMGWNELSISEPIHPILSDLGAAPHVYFVHGYCFHARDPSHVHATAEYGGTIAAAVGRDNMFGTQFHPEKSQKVGLKLLENFLRWHP